ncbi:Acetyltransferase (GNAT) domain-containing protein [Yoonia litorea]|uniref:Acetyltransferase (GNAT) domain-containing protein n=2 Tax=Yoonia litorea TaxID=1123755 RepID=A0A1I6LLJ2_9RHOB|nr:Acetyltransferase (GNAT) domain-containing protein [Yoonia litorea]
MEIGIRDFNAGDADWLIAEHATHYRDAEGFDETFGPLVAEIIGAFLEDHDASCERGWIAHDGDKRLGSIFCVASDGGMAKLRLFYVDKEARGTGVAQALLDRCLTFARQSGYSGLTLWTHESHRAAGAIYKRNGFARVDAKEVHSFGVDLVEETWRIHF